MSELIIPDVFSTGCPVSGDSVELVKSAACPSCEVSVLEYEQPVGWRACHGARHQVSARSCD